MTKRASAQLVGGTVVFGVLVLATAAGCLRYWRLERRYERLGVADVIVVPGYELSRDGRASPFLYNRIAMAKILLDGDYAPTILVSGGKPKSGVTEAAKMREIALAMGIPDERIVLEPQARTSVENARFSAALMKRLGMRSGLVVSDPAHLTYAVPVFRDAFESYGLELYWTPVDYALLEALGIARRPVRAPE